MVDGYFGGVSTAILVAIFVLGCMFWAMLRRCGQWSDGKWTRRDWRNRPPPPAPRYPAGSPPTSHVYQQDVQSNAFPVVTGSGQNFNSGDISSTRNPAAYFDHACSGNVFIISAENMFPSPPAYSRSTQPDPPPPYAP